MCRTLIVKNRNTVAKVSHCLANISEVPRYFSTAMCDSYLTNNNGKMEMKQCCCNKSLCNDGNFLKDCEKRIDDDSEFQCHLAANTAQIKISGIGRQVCTSSKFLS